MARRTGSIKRSLATALVIALCGLHVLASPTPAGAATTGVARVDASFGDGFKRYAISALDDEATAVAVLPGGGVVVVGRTGFDPYAQGTSSTDIVVARFTPSGRLDAAFGANGTVVIGQPGQWDRADAVAVQGDGRILLAGSVVTREGRLYAWGWNVLGQLGTGTTVDARSPRAVASLANVVAATGGFVHSVAITG